MRVFALLMFIQCIKEREKSNANSESYLKYDSLRPRLQKNHISTQAYFFKQSKIKQLLP